MSELRGNKLLCKMVAARGVRQTGYQDGDKFVSVPEMIPEIIVPSLDGFMLKPYVTYRTQEVTQSEFTAQELFNVIYHEKIVQDFEKGKLGPDGEPLEPSENEKLTPEMARARASSTGADMFAAAPTPLGVKPLGYRPI